MKFVYKAKKGTEDTVIGEVMANSRGEAISKIKEQGLFPIQVVEKEKIDELQKTSGARRKSSGGKFRIFKGARKRADLYDFTKKLKELTKAQLPLLSALFFIEEQVQDPGFKNVVRSILNSVKEGANFSAGLSKHPEYFDQMYVNIVKAGETSGKLDHSLEQIALYLDRDRKLRQKVLASMAYPVFMVLVGLATVIFLMAFVVPKMSVLFQDFYNDLPMPTKMLLFISGAVSKYWIIIGLTLAAFSAFLATPRGKAGRDAVFSVLKYKIPVVNKVIYFQSLSRFSTGLYILLASGIPVVEALRIAIALFDNEKYRLQLENAYKGLISGTGVETSLKVSTDFLPEMFIKMVGVGELSGRMDEILRDLGEGYSEEVESLTKMISSLIEPVAILLVGTILGFIVIAILLPIFEMSLFVE